VGRNAAGDGGGRQDDCALKKKTPRISIRGDCHIRSIEGMPRAPSLELCVLPSGGGQPKSKRVDRVSPLELYVLPKETGNQSSVGSTNISGCMPSGAEGSRTPDLLGAIQALSQLSYSPAIRGHGRTRRIPRTRIT
jgi:hypothetical protein